MIISGLVIAGSVSFSNDPKFKCFILERNDKCLFALQAYDHGEYDTSPFDQFDKRKCEIFGVPEGDRFIVKRMRVIDDASIQWEGAIVKKCPACSVSLFAGCDICPYCTAKC